jgi:hypothetical protein
MTSIFESDAKAAASDSKELFKRFQALARQGSIPG